MDTQQNPYSEITSNGFKVRIFSQDVSQEQLVWHRDKTDRKVTVLEQTDWQFQFDNELPQVLKDTIFIPKNTYHRVIKGTGSLHIEIQEL